MEVGRLAVERTRAKRMLLLPVTRLGDVTEDSGASVVQRGILFK